MTRKATCPGCGYNRPYHDSACRAVEHFTVCRVHLPGNAQDVSSTDDARSRPCAVCGEHATHVYSKRGLSG